MHVPLSWLALVNGDSKKSGSVPTRISNACISTPHPNRCQALHASSRKLASISKRRLQKIKNQGLSPLALAMLALPSRIQTGARHPVRGPQNGSCFFKPFFRRSPPLLLSPRMVNSNSMPCNPSLKLTDVPYAKLRTLRPLLVRSLLAMHPLDRPNLGPGWPVDREALRRLQGS